MNISKEKLTEMSWNAGEPCPLCGGELESAQEFSVVMTKKIISCPYCLCFKIEIAEVVSNLFSRMVF